MAMASLAETRDNETGMHLRRTQHYVRAYATHLVSDARYAGELTHEAIALLFKSAPQHDIVKVGISDGILLKPDRLNAQEFELMKEHAARGDQIIASAERMLDTPSSFLRFAREIARHHHENWDGRGYPDGLDGEAIPVSARLMAVADVYDALISKRCYKEPFSHEEASTLIIENSGRKFDSAIIDAFQCLNEEFQRIAMEFRDSDRDNLDQI